MELEGKIISFLGDSITEGNGVKDVNNRYDNIILKELKLSDVNNYGIGGTCFAFQKNRGLAPRNDLCFCGRAGYISTESNVIIVFGGTNDYERGQAPFGTMKDDLPNTYCGAVEYLMNYLCDAYPDASKIFMTPTRRKGDMCISNTPGKLNDAKPLLDYAEVVITKAKKYNIPVLDLYNILPINPNNTFDNNKYTTDGLHLNDEGHKVLAKYLVEFLKKL